MLQNGQSDGVFKPSLMPQCEKFLFICPKMSQRQAEGQNHFLEFGDCSPSACAIFV